MMSKKNCILETTLELIQEHGFHGTSVNMIACKAGAATGTIYHYYSSKDELITALFRYVNEQLLSAIDLGKEESAPFKERFFLFWRSQYRFYIERPEVLKFNEQYMSSPYYTEAEMEMHMNMYTGVTAFFDQAISKREIRNMHKEILSPVIHGSIVACANLHINRNHRFSGEDLDKVMEIVWAGIKV